MASNETIGIPPDDVSVDQEQVAMGNDTLSRRQVLKAVAGAGTAGTGVGASTGFLADRESVDEVTVAAGRLNLETCWHDTDDCDQPLSIDVGPHAGDSGTETVEYRLPPDSNPAYVQVRTDCPADACGLYRDLDVTVRDGPPVGPSDEIASGSLCNVLADLHGGVTLAGGEAVDAGTERRLEFEWVLDEKLDEDDTVEGIDVEFRAVQSRNVPDAAAVDQWGGGACDVTCSAHDCDGTGHHGKAISWIGFCGDGKMTDDHFDFEVDGDTLRLHDAPDSLGTVLLKGGQTLDVFRDPEKATFVIGAGEDRYDQERGFFPETETDRPRSNKLPCPDHGGLRYEIGHGFENADREPETRDRHEGDAAESTGTDQGRDAADREPGTAVDGEAERGGDDE
jgi:hypothetical protein